MVQQQHGRDEQIRNGVFCEATRFKGVIYEQRANTSTVNRPGDPFPGRSISLLVTDDQSGGAGGGKQFSKRNAGLRNLDRRHLMIRRALITLSIGVRSKLFP